MRLVIDGDRHEIAALLNGEPVTTELKPVPAVHDPLPIRVHWLLSSAATLLIVIGLWAVIRGVFG